MTEFETSAAELGSLYLVATLSSALAFSRIGAWIDRIGLRPYSIAAGGLLLLACLVTASASNLIVLGVGLFALRLSGQGLMPHIQTTATVRAFTEGRGIALGFAGLGIPLASAVFPAIALFLIAAIGWRWAYASIGISVFALLIVTQVALFPADGDVPRIRTRDSVDAMPDVRPSESMPRPAAAPSLMRSGYFWAAVPMMLVVSFASTALLFQLTVIAADRNWTPGWIAAGFPIMALAHVAALFMSGRAIDLYSARAVAVFHAVPLTISVLLLAAFEDPVVLLIAMFGLGLSGGASQTAFAAVWAEIYGVRRYGAIRSIAMSLMVVASAGGPLVLGLAFSATPTISDALIVLALIVVALQVPLSVVELMRFLGRKAGQ